MEAENTDYWRMAPERRDAQPSFFAERIADPRTCVLVAEYTENGTSSCVGTLTGAIDENKDIGHYGSLDDAWVDLPHRRRGLSRQMFEKILVFFREHRVEHLSVGYIHGGEAQGFWRNLGFRPTVVVSNATMQQFEVNEMDRTPCVPL